jgi:hypothetical protein
VVYSVLIVRVLQNKSCFRIVEIMATPSPHPIKKAYDTPICYDLGSEQDGSRPRMPKERVVDPDCGGENPTTYTIDEEDGERVSCRLAK